MKNKVVTPQDVYDLLNEKYDFSKGESWDRNGLFFNHNQPITNITIALELTSKVLNEAILMNSNLIITHHPLFTENEVTEEYPFFVNHKVLNKVKENNIALIHLHTPFDISKNGMNMRMAQKLELKNIVQDKENPYIVVGETKMGIGLEYVARVIKQAFNSPLIKYNDIYKTSNVFRIGIVAGSGYSFIDEAFEKYKIDTFLTSDLKHQNWIDAQEKGYNVIDINHLSETFFVDIIYNDLLKVIKEENLIKVLSTLKLNLV